MKNRIFFLFIFNSLLINLNLSGQPGTWSWINGTNITGDPGVFGTQGVSSPANYPPGVYEAAEFKDLQGNFWLFGGLNSGFSDYGDLWKYDPLTNEWAWIKGSGTLNSTGSYGTQGVPSLSNFPSARSWGIASWVDLNGDFWIYGGYSTNGIMNDLWRYNIATNTWTWIQGSSAAGQPSVYGSLGVPSPANTPGSRYECNTTWVDNNNNLWLSNGYSGGSSFNDLWKYDPLINQWTWMNGANFFGQAGVYGTQGVPNSANVPGARQSYTHWKDSNGNFWFFGGFDYSVGVAFNDMWMYNPVTNMWTWMSGSNTTNSLGNYGTQCIPSVFNAPSARFENRCFWTDSYGNFWIYGGGNGGSFQTNYGDLWMFNPVTTEWTYVSGDNTPNPSAVYGTLGVPSLTNKPGGRSGNIGWTDNAGNLYLFGGNVNAWPAPGNDLFKFEIDPNCPQINSVMPVANFAASDTAICQNSCINFNNTSFAGSSYQWSFPGAQTTSSTVVNPTNICYTNPGYYDVTVIACNAVGCDTLVFPNYIYVDSLPVISLGADTVICSGDSLLLDAGTGFNSYLWSNNSTTQSVFVSAGGVYAVQITSIACTVTDSISVSTQNCTSTIALFSSSDTSFCEKKCLDFTDLSTNNPTSWQWLFPGADSLSSTEQNPTGICYSAYGSFDVTLIACNASDCDTLHMINFINEYQAPPVPVITSNFDTLFSTPAFSYQWYNSSGIISGATNSYYVYQQPGSYYVFVTDSNGCASSSVVIYTLIGENTGLNGEIYLVPNPSDGNFEINFGDLNNSQMELKIFDAVGKLLFNTNSGTNNNKININVADGLYFLQVTTGVKIFRSKFVVKTN